MEKLYRVTRKDHRNGKIRLERNGTKLYIIAPELGMGDTISHEQLKYIVNRMIKNGDI